MALFGASLCLVQAASNSLTPNQPVLVYLEPRSRGHYIKRHQIDNNYHSFQKQESKLLDKRSSERDYDRAIRYMEKAKKSYEKAQGQQSGDRRTSRSRSRNRKSNSRPSRSRHRTSDRYDQSLDYTTGYNDNSAGYDRYNTGYGGSIGSPPFPPMGLSPPSPPGSESAGGKDGTSSEVEAWGLKNGKIPEGADIEEEDKPDPEQDPSDNDDPPIVDGKPVAREE
jgi:hypothetical protein